LITYHAQKKLPFISPFPQLLYPAATVLYHLRRSAACSSISSKFECE